MKDLFIVAKFTIKDMIKRKSFIVSNIIIFLFIIVGFNVPNIMDAINGDENGSSKSYIVDNNNIYEGTLSNLNDMDLGYEFIIEDKQIKLDEIKEKVNNGEVDEAIVINDASFTTVTEFKQYLSQNPLTIKFVLATPTTKTVDLTVVNQDGNETKLRTFDETTHVLLESEAGPNPGAKLTVRTKIPSASSTSLLMDDISTNQKQLETKVDEQSENIDATMIATTEIYEVTL